MHDTLALLPAGPDLPPLPPPRADLQPDVRVQRELHPAAVPRRGRARQGLAVLRRWPATAGRSSPTCGRCTPTCGRIPGKKLLFMGGEFAQHDEWSHERSLDWHLLERPEHAGIQSLVRDLNRAYRDEPALWELDSDPAGFCWLEPNDADANVIAFARLSRTRRGESRVLVFVANLSPVPRAGYRLGLPRAGRWREALNTDSHVYGGSDVGNLGGVERRAGPVARPAVLGRGHAAAAGGDLARTGEGLESSDAGVPVGASRSARGRGTTGSTEFRSGRREAEPVGLTARRRGRRRQRAGSPARARPATGSTRWPRGPSRRRLLVRSVDGRRAPRSVLALAAGRAARALAGLRAGRGRRAFTPAPLQRAGDLRAARRHVQPGGDLRGRDPLPAASSPSWASRRSRSCRWPSSPARAAGATTASTSSAAQSSYGGPAGLQQLVAAAHEQGLAVILDVVYNHVGASGVTALDGVRAVLHREVRDPVGQGDQLRRRRLRPGPRVGAAERRGLDPRLRHRRPAARRHPRDLRLERRAHRRRRSPAASTRSTRARLVIAESGLNDPKVMRPATAGGYGCDAAWADDFHHALRTLLTGERDGYYAEFGQVGRARQGLSPPARPRRRLLGLPPAPLRRPGRRRPAGAVRRLRPEPRPGRQPRLRRPDARRGPAAGGVLHAAVAVHADAVHGRGVRRARRRSSSSPTTSTSEIAEATREGRRREFAAFASFGQRDPRPAGLRRRSSARSSPASAIPRWRALYARAAGGAPPAPRAGEAEQIEFDEAAALAAGPARRLRAGLQLRCREPLELRGGDDGLVSSTSRPRERGRDRAPSAARRRCREPLERGMTEVWPGQPVPARARAGTATAPTSRSSPSTPRASSCACSTTTATRRGSR